MNNLEVPYDIVISGTCLKPDNKMSNQFKGISKRVIKIDDAHQSKKIFECFRQVYSQ